MKQFLCLLLAAFVCTTALPQIPSVTFTPLSILSGLDGYTALYNYFENGIDNGVLIQLPGQLGYFKLGLISLPNQVCLVDALRPIGCRVCSQDCLLVHNKYGGGCGVNPNRADLGQICLCNDERPANQTVPTPTDSCGALYDGVSDTLLNNAIGQAAIIRAGLGLCQPNLITGDTDSTGCNTDCILNHGYNSGLCQKAIGVPQNPSQNATSNPSAVYCVCS